MPQDLQRMEDALRSAAAAGDDTAATRIAEAIRNRRAKGDQAAPTPPLDVEPSDPLSDIPTEVDGFKLSQDIRQEIMNVRTGVEDPKKLRLATARIAGRLAALDDSGNFADKVAKGQFGAGLRGFANLLGIGDAAAAAGTALGGIGDEKAMSFGEALEAQREFRRALEGEFPITSIAGEVAGAAVGGSGIVKGLASAAKALPSSIGAVITSVSQLQKGQKLKNIARMSAGGATVAGITEGVTEGEAAKGAILGLAAGPLSAGLVKAGQITKAGITKMLDDPAAAGIKALAKKLGVTSEEMGRRFLEFKTVTGKNPPVADIANHEAVAEVRHMIINQPSAAAAAREGVEAILETRGADVAKQLTGGRVTTTQAAQKARRTSIAEETFAEAEQDTIKFSKGQVADLLNDPDLRRGIPRTLKRRLDDAMDAAGEGAPLNLTGLDVNDLRKALRLRAKGATGADRVFGELAEEVEDIARKQSPKFGQAIDEFARRSVTGEGVATGRKVIGAQTGEFVQAAKVAEAAGGAGQRVGARTAIAETAGEGASKADRLVKALSEESGLIQRLRSVLPAEEVNKIREVAKLQVRAGRNISTLAPAARAQAERGLRDAVNDAVGGIVAATGGAGAGFKANVVTRVLGRLIPGSNPKVLDNIARDFLDPTKTKQVIAALRRAEVAEDKILELYAKAALSAGASAGASQ